MRRSDHVVLERLYQAIFLRYLHGFGDAEVDQLYAFIHALDDVLGLDVAVNNILATDGIQRSCHLLDDTEHTLLCHPGVT